MKKDTAMANLFMDLCIGSTNGHMASIPNNPTLNALFTAKGACYNTGGRKEFVKVLREFADDIESGLPKNDDDAAFPF